MRKLINWAAMLYTPSFSYLIDGVHYIIMAQNLAILTTLLVALWNRQACMCFGTQGAMWGVAGSSA